MLRRVPPSGIFHGAKRMDGKEMLYATKTDFEDADFIESPFVDEIVNPGTGKKY